MAASIAGRSTFLRTLCSKPSYFRTTSRFSASQSPMNSLLVFPCTRILPRSMRFPWELGSLLPAYSAIASACLVSKLPDRPNAVAECRFANFVSPI